MNTLLPKGCRGRAWLGFVFLVFVTWSATAGPKRVLIVHSFGSAAPPFTTHSVAFETELTEQIGEQVDLDEVSLDMARYPDVDMQEAFVEYLHRRQAKWQPDLVVPVGSPASVFVAQYKERLYPNTPILYTGMDKRRLPPEALLTNAAFVGENFNVPEFVEEILQVAPATTNIAVVIGDSQVERYWAAAFRDEFAPYTNRVGFTWLNHLPFDQMLDTVSKLPPRSFIFVILLLRDASGVTHNADEALKRIHAVANAPVNSIFQHQLGMGIVGGRLYQAELEGKESARIAIRILDGEPASKFPPLIIEPLGPRYDWRELHRWKISEDRLPAESTILFRMPTVWQRYQGWITAGVSVCLFEALLIFVLVANLAKRRRAERSLAESENRFRIAADAAPIMMWMTGIDKQCVFVNKMWLEFTGRTLEQAQGNGWTENVHPDDLPRCLKSYDDAFDERLPFVIEFRLQRHQQEFRWICSSGKPRLDVQGNFVGYIGSCVDVTEARREAEALAESESRLRSILNTAVEGIITINNRGTIESVNAATLKLFGYSSEELVGQNVSMLMPRTPTEERDLFPDKNQTNGASSVIGSGREVSAQRKDGSLFPIDLAVSEIKLQGRHVYTGFIRDVTDRKEAERTSQELNQRLIRAQEEERSRLARELHDDITQRLARLAIDAGRAESGMPLAEMAVMMRELREGLSHLSEDVHSLSYKLHPSVLDDLGLADALRAECERFSKREAIASEIALRDVPDALPRDTGLGLFRVTQEALRNVARHAHASAVEVSLSRIDGGLQLAIRDNGSGFEPSLKRERLSLGLASMRERMRLLGGELDIESGPGQGTTIVAWVPVKIGTL